MKINEFFLERQRKLQRGMIENSAAIIFANAETKRNGDSNYPFRQNSDLLYLTGFPEPEAIALFVNGKYILFNRDRDSTMEIWYGYRIGQEQACSDYGADEAYSITTADSRIPELIKGCEALYFNMNPATNTRVQGWLAKLSGQSRAGINPPDTLINLAELSHEQRLIKDEFEIEVLRRAAQISAAAHLQVMKACKPGMMEYELEAELRYGYIKHGGREVAFNSIVGSGANGCTLHYEANNAELKNGNLVLVDAGVEYQNYAADITRTFPINGKFSAEQRLLYQAVLDAQLAAIAKIKPGAEWNELQEAACAVLTERLVVLGIPGELKQYYMHHIGHWIGLDDHDVGRYRTREGNWRVLEPGMVLTVEPGLYIRADSPGVEQKWHNIGIRIEDEVLVTENGYEILTAGVPKTIAEIEAVMS